MTDSAPPTGDAASAAAAAAARAGAGAGGAGAGGAGAGAGAGDAGAGAADDAGAASAGTGAAAGAGDAIGGLPVESSTRDTVTVRRSPRYGRFIILGVGAGAVLTFVLTNLFPIDDEVGFGPLFGYLLLFGIPLGAALGGLFAVLLDMTASRRATVIEAERTSVDPTPEELDGDLED